MRIIIMILYCCGKHKGGKKLKLNYKTDKLYEGPIPYGVIGCTGIHINLIYK